MVHLSSLLLLVQCSYDSWTDYKLQDKKWTMPLLCTSESYYAFKFRGFPRLGALPLDPARGKALDPHCRLGLRVRHDPPSLLPGSLQPPPPWARQDVEVLVVRRTDTDTDCQRRGGFVEVCPTSWWQVDWRTDRCEWVVEPRSVSGHATTSISNIALGLFMHIRLLVKSWQNTTLQWRKIKSDGNRTRKS